MTTSDDEPDLRPAFRTARLLAEPVMAEHAAAMADVLADPRIHRFLDDDPPLEHDLERRYRFLEGGLSPDGTEHWLTWILRLASPEAPPIGFVQATIVEPLDVTIAYVVHPDHWRRGFAREAIAAMLDTVFANFDVREAVAEMDVENLASFALAESLGFTYVHTVPTLVERDGQTPRPGREYRYTLSREAWLKRSRVGG